MKVFFLFFIVIFCLGCKSLGHEYNNTDKLGFHQELKKTFIEGSNLDECSEEISKLEDAYLANVKGLKGYSWNKDKFVAEIEISKNKKLEISIKPFGDKCDSVRKSVTFTVPNSFFFNENKNEIINDFLWISKLICDEDEFSVISGTLNKKKDSTIKNIQDDNFIFLFPELNGDEIGFSDDVFLKSFVAFFKKEFNLNSYTIFYVFQ